MTERYQGEERQPIVQWYIPDVAPEGRTPIAMRQEWRGVPLPVRRAYDAGTDSHATEPSDIVLVQWLDALKALNLAGKEPVAQWWRAWCDGLSIQPDSPLMFLKKEGKLISAAEAAQTFPDTIQFELKNT